MRRIVCSAGLLAGLLACSVGVFAQATFHDEGGGVLRDTRTGLFWTQSDNGADISWGDASRYCSGMGRAWRLPNTYELHSPDLQGIYGTGRGVSPQCGFSRCNVSPLFRLTSIWFWSSESDGASEAWFVDLRFGGRDSHGVGNTRNLRALCVRRP